MNIETALALLSSNGYVTKKVIKLTEKAKQTIPSHHLYAPFIDDADIKSLVMRLAQNGLMTLSY